MSVYFFVFAKIYTIYFGRMIIMMRIMLDRVTTKLHQSLTLEMVMRYMFFHCFYLLFSFQFVIFTGNSFCYYMFLLSELYLFLLLSFSITRDIYVVLICSFYQIFIHGYNFCYYMRNLLVTYFVTNF